MKKLFITGIIYISLFILLIGCIYGLGRQFAGKENESDKVVTNAEGADIKVAGGSLSDPDVNIVSQERDSSSGSSVSESNEGVDEDGDGTENVQNEEEVAVQGDISNNVTPFYYRTTADKYLLDMCYAGLTSSDNNERKNITKDVSCLYDKNTDTTVFRITIDENAVNAKGEPITADDIIFNYYIRADVGYSGDGGIAALPIAGLQEYRYGTKDVKKMKKKIAEKLKKPDKRTKALIKKKIIRPVLEEEYKWVCSLYKQEMYDYITDKYPKKKDLFVYFFAYGTDYKVKKKKLERVLDDVVASYGSDYKKLGKVTGENYNKKAENIALSVIWEEKNHKYGVKTISGIKKIDDHVIRITVKGKRKKGYASTLCNMYIASLSIWGNESLYNGENSFGLKRGKADDVIKGKKIDGDETGKYTIIGKNKESYILKLQNNP